MDKQSFWLTHFSLLLHRRTFDILSTARKAREENTGF